MWKILFQIYHEDIISFVAPAHGCLNDENEKKSETQEDRGWQRTTLQHNFFIIVKTLFFVLKAITHFLFVYPLLSFENIIYLQVYLLILSFFSVWKKAMNHVEFFSLTAEESDKKKSYQQITHKDERKGKSFI